MDVPTLTSPGLTLRTVCEADIPGWFLRASDAEACHLAGDPVQTDPAQGAVWLDRRRRRFAEGLELGWAIVPEGQGESVGTITLTRPEPGAATANLGFVLARKVWGRGLATAAGRLVVDHAFSRAGLTGLYGEVLVENVASRRVMVKLGFVEDPPAPSPEDGLMCVMCHLRRA